MQQSGRPGPAEIWHAGPAVTTRLADLGLTGSDLKDPLRRALADARLCTDLDAPGAAGFIFWTRANRYLREQLKPRKWGWTSRDNILRTIDPENSFTITATSGAGDIGCDRGRVRTRNRKGSAVDQLVRYNRHVHGGGIWTVQPLWQEAAPQFEPGMLPTWFLLYQLDDDGIRCELSLPIDMDGSLVNRWREHILLPTISPGGGGPVVGGIDLITDPDDEDPGDEGPDVPVERRS